MIKKKREVFFSIAGAGRRLRQLTPGRHKSHLPSEFGPAMKPKRNKKKEEKIDTYKKKRSENQDVDGCRRE